MSAEIYSAPEEVAVPKWDSPNWMEEENDYIKNLKAHINKMGYKGKNVGEVIKFSVADGYALYMVLNMNPVKLIHLELGDAYQFQYAHLMTGEEVQGLIDRDRAMAKLFSKKS